MSVFPKTPSEAVAFFADADTSRRCVAALRWPDGIACPVCGSRWLHFDRTRNGWECHTRHPRRRFTLKTGTLFEDSSVPISKWLVAIWIFAGSATVPNSRALARRLGVTQKTAWFMLLRIRIAARLAALAERH